MEKNRANTPLMIRLAGLLIALVLMSSSPLIFGINSPSASGGKTEEGIRRILLGRYPDLLTEKGICDEKGREIDGRLDELIRAAKTKGLTREKQVLSFILRELNHSPSNLGAFPQCAFDRPIGSTLAWYGKTVAPGNIDGQAEGSACPVGGIGSGSYEWTMSGNFRYWF